VRAAITEQSGRAGRLGGQATLERHGREHFRRLGFATAARLGFDSRGFSISQVNAGRTGRGHDLDDLDQQLGRFREGIMDALSFMQERRLNMAQQATIFARYLGKALLPQNTTSSIKVGEIINTDYKPRNWFVIPDKKGRG